MKKISKTVLSCLAVVMLFNYCTSVRTPLKTYNDAGAPFDLEVLSGTREVVLRQEKPWEEQTLAYYKVLKTGKHNWQMWYSSWDNRRNDDYSGYLPYAYSANGKDWTKAVPGNKNNILFGSGFPKKDGIVEQDVFIDGHSPLKYKMLFTARDPADGGKQKTFYMESADGIKWTDRRVLWNKKFDSQFSVLVKDSLYHIYLRMWEVVNHIRYRVIGHAIADRNWRVIKEPEVILRSPYPDFPHIYNNATSGINDSLQVFLPTFFNEKEDRVRVRVAYSIKGQAHLMDADITDDLYHGEDVKWGCVNPGLIPAGKNRYWLYYYGVNKSHNRFMEKGHVAKYYRVLVAVKFR
ncbi:exo-alpha-sialidase [Pedobacter heparinus]|nr:exo-alpha-sialidase [Pedobacter heparinus]